MTTSSLSTGVFVLLFCAWSGFALAEEPDLTAVMQGLRDDLVMVTDGLLQDDYELIARGAAGIAAHPPIAAAQVTRIAAELGPEMQVFKGIDTEVHDLAVAIGSAAAARDREAVRVDFDRMMTGCLACHSAYRDRVLRALAPTP